MCLTQIIGLSLCRLAADFKPSPRATRTKAYNYKRADFDSLRAALRLVPWTMLSDCSVDDAVPMFCDFAFAEGKTFQQCVSNPSKLQKTDRKKQKTSENCGCHATRRVVLIIASECRRGRSPGSDCRHSWQQPYPAPGGRPPNAEPRGPGACRGYRVTVC